MSAKPVIRAARRQDCPEIRRLIGELAEFENMEYGPKINAETLEKDGFDVEPALYKCLVVENPNQKEGCRLIGYALYYSTYSTWRGKKFYLEDIFIEEEYRGQGVGRALFQMVCREAREMECETMAFSVLGWNPAKKFYADFGSEDVTISSDWHLHSLEKEFFLKAAAAADAQNS